VRIAYAIESPLRYGGGVSVLVATLMEAFLGDHEIILISPDRKEDLLHDTVGSRCKKHIRWLCEKNPPSSEFSEISSKTLAQIIQAKPDLVHFHSGGVFSWGNRWPGASWPAYLKKHNIPSIWTNHSVVGLFHGFCGNLKPWWFKLGMLPWSYFGKSQQLRSTTIEICVSDHDATKIRRWYFPFRKKIVRIYHSRLGGSEIRASGNPREKMILAVGHLALRKGQHILVQAFAKIARQHPSWNLVLVGPESADGCADWIRSFCRKEGLENQVKLMGPRTDAREWMKKCAIFVQPSLEEALGLALQEAMACGCACIGTKVGGIPELISEGSGGRLVDPGNPNQLSRTLHELVKSEEKRSALGLGAVRQIAALGMNRKSMIEAHRNLYQEAWFQG
jgi:glycosyltransferase involved in cell wall biosynthesis